MQTQVVTGTVVAKDGLTVALGGLINEGVADSRAEVPVLGKLPVIGFFFRRQVTIRSRNELVVLIRPYVFNTPSESAALSADLVPDMSLHPKAVNPVGSLNTLRLAGSSPAQPAAKPAANDLPVPQCRSDHLLTPTAAACAEHLGPSSSACCAAAVAASWGCSKSLNPFANSDSGKDPKHPNMQPGQMQVLAEGGLSLEIQKDKQQACGELLTTLEKLLGEQRRTTARRLVFRHPDLSLEILQTAADGRAKSPAVGFVAAARDAQCSLASPVEGWEALIADRTANPDRYSDYDKARAKLFEAFKLGDGQQAVNLSLVKLASRSPNSLLAIDALMLTGMAQLFAKRPADAVATFQRAADLAQQADAHQVPQALLMLGNAQRLTGDYAASIQSWQRATTAAAELLARPIPIADPAVWERALYLRPAQVNWPAAVLAQLEITGGLKSAGTSQSNLAAGGGEAPVFVCLGQWRLARNEPQAALLAFKRAESATPDATAHNQLWLAEAKCLSRLQQVGAATAVLMGMAKNTDPAISRPALALLGSIKLEEGQSEFGQRLLQKALEVEPAVEWPARGEAEADLGLADLMLGDEPSGLRWLHRAQGRFQATGQHELLAKSLWNEARYFEHKGKHKAEVAALQEKLQAMESGMPDPAANPAAR